MGYSREQQVEDLACIDRTRAMLSGRIVGERQIECERYVGDYARIARYFVAYDKVLKTQSNTRFSRSVARMFQEIALAPQISGLAVGRYDNLLVQVRRKIRAMIQMRRKKPNTCLFPKVHPPKCACGNLARFRAKNLVVD